MKNTIFFALFIIAMTFSQKGYGQFDESDKTLSPYFFIKSENPSLDQLPLKSTSAEVNIAGIIADVRVNQVYSNEGNTPIEAVYVFPASTRAAVYAMEMKVGDRVITAKIWEKGKARKAYEVAKSQGKRTSLLEQNRPNVFTMNVANIMPGDKIEVSLNYTETMIPEEGLYSFVYPTVVGPRFTEETESTASIDDLFLYSPYTKSNELPYYNLDITVNLDAGLPIQNILSQSHDINVTYGNTNTASVFLNPTENNGGNRDFILNYQLAGKEIASGLLLYEGEEENFFLLTVQPPKRVSIDEIPPREYIFVVDVSGSMRGFPLDVSKKLLRDLVVNLRPTDKFNVLFFAGSAFVLAEESLHATEENINEALTLISKQSGGGRTQLLPALKMAMNLPRCEEELSRSIVIATDGYVSVEKEAFDLIRNNLDRANVFSFGIGKSINRHLIEGMAKVGMGEPLIITSLAEAPSRAEKFRKYINTPVLSQVKVDFGDFEVYDVEPLSLPDVMVERPITIYGKYRGEAKGTVQIKGYAGKERHKMVYKVKDASINPKNSALKYLWAREKIRLLTDYGHVSNGGVHQNAIIALGLKYNLMTAFTSFLAVDTEIPNEQASKAGKQSPTKKSPTRIKQPLPMPQGVQNSAIGFDMAIDGVVRKSEKKPMAGKLDGVSSNLDATLNQKIKVQFEQKINEILACKKGSSPTPQMLIFELRIDANGKIIDVKLSNELEECIKLCMMEQIKGWQITGLDLDRTIDVVMPLNI